MDQLPLTTVTHGDGVDCDGAGSDDDDGGASTYVPSFAPTNASGMPGDLDDFGDHDEIDLKPQWGDDQTCSVGVWGTKTRGGGERPSVGSV